MRNSTHDSSSKWCCISCCAQIDDLAIVAEAAVLCKGPATRLNKCKMRMHFIPKICSLKARHVHILRMLLILWSDWMHSTACYARLCIDWLKFANKRVCGQLSAHSIVHSLIHSFIHLISLLLFSRRCGRPFTLYGKLVNISNKVWR